MNEIRAFMDSCTKPPVNHPTIISLYVATYLPWLAVTGGNTKAIFLCIPPYTHSTLTHISFPRNPAQNLVKRKACTATFTVFLLIPFLFQSIQSHQKSLFADKAGCKWHSPVQTIQCQIKDESVSSFVMSFMFKKETISPALKLYCGEDSKWEKACPLGLAPAAFLQNGECFFDIAVNK